MESLELSRSFWRDKRVLMTGHTGFKGSWMSLWLQSLGADLTGFALNPPTHPCLFDEARVAKGMHSVIADVRDANALSKAMRDAKPEIVIHMAAQSLVRYSYQAPVETYSTNVIGTAHVLEAVRLGNGVRAVLNITSDKCYENQERSRGYREDDRMGGYDPYSNSKACAELLTAAYRSSYFNPAQYKQHGVALATARAGNVIGGGDWAADRLVPDMLRAIEAGYSVAIRNPQAIRPWQHVLEPLSGYLALVEKLYREGSAFAESWNFGPEEADAKPVQWVVEKLAQSWGEGASWQINSCPQPHEANYLKLDCAKAAARLNWRPRMRLQDSLDDIVAWHKAFLAGADMKSITLQQISRYEALRA